MTDQTNDEQAPLDDLIGIGSEIAGGAAGAAIGFFAAGPVGAVAGGAAGPIVTHTFRKLAAELKQRVLGRGEEIRLGATLAFAAAKISENIANGQQVRQDDFFLERSGDRSAAEEIAEGVLLIAQREYQERKLKFYGNLLANIAFRTDIDRDLANALIIQAERMSYRQMCILPLIVRSNEFSVPLGRGYTLAQDNAKFSSLVADIYDLAQQGIMDDDPLDRRGMISVGRELAPGRLLFDLMELKDIDKVELERIAVYLKPEVEEKPDEGTEAASAG
ncbi:MAG TPA: hypothetical protein VGJ87_19710 [Roseiflexaceae bacterium]|jgi:hypothetical protein